MLGDLFQIWNIEKKDLKIKICNFFATDSICIWYFIFAKTIFNHPSDSGNTEWTCLRNVISIISIGFCLNKFVLSWSNCIVYLFRKNQGTEIIQNLPNFILQVRNKTRFWDNGTWLQISNWFLGFNATCVRRPYKILRKYFYHLVFKFYVKVLNHLTVKYV